MDTVMQEDWGLEPLHEKMLEILKAFDAICSSSNIQYCLAYGSALGAKRHEGFIPWDDDVDVYMDYKDFQKFKKAFANSECSKGLYLQELYVLNGVGTMIKIRMDGTTFIEELYKNSDIHQGIYIDLFLLSGGSTNRIEQIIENVCGRYITIKRLADIGYSRRRVYLPILKLLALLPKKFLCGRASKKLRKRDADLTGYYREPDRNSKMSVFPKTWLFPAKRSLFSGVELCVPAEMEKYLEMMYGDYMKIPQIDRIRWKQHAAIWKVDEGFDKNNRYAVMFKDEK